MLREAVPRMSEIMRSNRERSQKSCFPGLLACKQSDFIEAKTPSLSSYALRSNFILDVFKYEGFWLIEGAFKR
jgi:hypothetical protein